VATQSELFKAYEKVAWANPPASLVESAKYLADDFKLLDKQGKVVMTREAYIGMGPLLATAFKDITYVVKELRDEGDSAIVTGHFEGTHTGNFDLTAMGAGVIPASGKKIVWPDSTEKWKFVGDKIVSLTNMEETDPMVSFLAPLGVEQPTH
jgi:SnoaL-like polyketide cyclase